MGGYFFFLFVLLLVGLEWMRVQGNRILPGSRRLTIVGLVGVIATVAFVGGVLLMFRVWNVLGGFGSGDALIVDTRILSYLIVVLCVAGTAVIWGWFVLELVRVPRTLCFRGISRDVLTMSLMKTLQKKGVEFTHRWGLFKQAFVFEGGGLALHVAPIGCWVVAKRKDETHKSLLAALVEELKEVMERRGEYVRVDERLGI